MVIEIIVAIGTTITLIWLFFEYLKWAEGYDGSAQYNEELKNDIRYNAIPPAAVYDSRKVVNFWMEFYKAKYLQ